MSIFGGQYGSFGGGYITGGAGQTTAPAMQFGGGFLQAPQGAPPVPATIRGSVEVVYAAVPVSMRPRDRSGRRGRYERRDEWSHIQGGVHRQKRY
jgi:hypothetical protein